MLGHSTPRRPKLAIRDSVVNPSSICNLLVYRCEQPRLSYPCPNNNDCGSSQFERFGGINELMRFRSRFWESSSRSFLTQTLWELSLDRGDGDRTINYVICGRSVCKCFFRAATGLSRQLFDSCVQQVLKGDGILVPETKKNMMELLDDEEYMRPSNADMYVLGFLDSYFSEVRVQYDPASKDKLMVHKTWKNLYNEDYKPYCTAADVRPASYTQFCNTRRCWRPQFKVAKSYRRRGKSFVQLLF